MKGFNKVVLMGNLTRDPETRMTPNGQSVTGFGIAVTKNWTGKDGQKGESTDFFECVAWGKVGEIIAQYTQKGRALLISGRLASRSWEQDGQKRTKVEVVIEDFNFISDGKRQEVEDRNDDSAKDEVVLDDYNDEPVDLSDIPF